MALRIELERHGPVACVTLASPERGNAFGPQDFARLAAVFEQAWADVGTRALVLTGRGKQFSAGADIEDLDAVGDADMAALVAAQTERIVSAFAMSPLPTVVAVNGPVAGAACGLVLMADIAVASDTARLLFPFARLGLVPDTGLSRLLAQQIGAARARRILFEGGRITAAEALEWGMLRSVHAPESLHAEAIACAAGLAAMPSGVHAAMRALLSDASALSAGLGREAEAQSARLRHPETVAAISAAAQAMASRRH